MKTSVDNGTQITQEASPITKSAPPEFSKKSVGLGPRSVVQVNQRSGGESAGNSSESGVLGMTWGLQKKG